MLTSRNVRIINIFEKPSLHLFIIININITILSFFHLITFLKIYLSFFFIIIFITIIIVIIIINNNNNTIIIIIIIIIFSDFSLVFSSSHMFYQFSFSMLLCFLFLDLYKFLSIANAEDKYFIR